MMALAIVGATVAAVMVGMAIAAIVPLLSDAGSADPSTGRSAAATEGPVDPATALTPASTPLVPAEVPGGVVEEAPATYILIDPGTFTMGTPLSEEGRFEDEVEHTVTLTRAFTLKRTEVTQLEWRVLMQNNPSHHSGCDACPVERVSWYDAVAYVNALSTQEGLSPCYATRCTGTAGIDDFLCSSVTFEGLSCTGYRLPTEAEWEYAARAGITVARYGELDSVAWFGGNAEGRSHPVGQKLGNAWGLVDMLGNVWEWCQDGYGAYGVTSVADPQGVDGAVFRVNRGGSWFYPAQFARSGLRGGRGPGYRYVNLGFRPARSIP